MTELIHQLTNISRKHGNLNVVLKDNEVVGARMQINTESKEKEIVLISVDDMQDQTA